MYRQFYGLTSQPFSLHPDPAVFYSGTQHTTAKTILEYAVMRREGILVLTGEVGCGKTMVIRHFLAKGAADSCVGVVSNPSALKETLMTGILMAFGQQALSGEGALLHANFQAFLRSQHAIGRATILIVDEAQNLSLEMLEELRMLTNSEPGSEGALQLVLVGQPQLQQLLYRPDLSQLLQRVVAHYHLQPLSLGETVEYVVHRMQCAGCERPIFTPAALSAIYQGAHGIPRLINMICDIALLYGYTEELDEIDADVVDQVIADRGLSGPEAGSAAPASLPAPPAAAAESDGIDRQISGKSEKKKRS